MRLFAQISSIFRLEIPCGKIALLRDSHEMINKLLFHQEWATSYFTTRFSRLKFHSDVTFKQQENALLTIRLVCYGCFFLWISLFMFQLPRWLWSTEQSLLRLISCRLRFPLDWQDKPTFRSRRVVY